MVSVYRGDQRAGKMTGVRHLLPHRWHLCAPRLQIIVESCCRDGCALLWRIQKAFCKNAQPASVRCRSERVWDFPTSILQRKNGLCIYEDTACHGYERLLNCKMIFQLLYWAYQFFSGGCRSDCTDNANQEQTLPHLR